MLKLGATLAYTECRLFRGSDGALMARGWHVKHVVPPLPLSPLLSLRPALAARLLAHLAPVRQRAAAKAAAAAAEPEPRDEKGKTEYFGRFGEIGHDLLGWDAPLQVAAMTITTTIDDDGDKTAYRHHSCYYYCCCRRRCRTRSALREKGQRQAAAAWRPPPAGASRLVLRT